MEVQHVIDEFPLELRAPVLHLVTALRDERGVSREDFSELKDAMRELAQAQARMDKYFEELAQAQTRTENRVEELAQAQTRTENRVEELARIMHQGFKELRDSISALGSRWGIQNESAIRNTLQGVLGETNYSVKRGHYGNREVDIVIRGDGTHILLEVTAAL